MRSLNQIATLTSMGPDPKAASDVVSAFQKIEEARLGLRLYTDRDENGDQIWTAAAVLQPAKQLVDMMPNLSRTLMNLAHGQEAATDYDLGNTQRTLDHIAGKKQVN
ncbi:hypothetical protein [Sphingomonas paucimobilis]|uniref:hypothetical protein n=1 Tax=Sphingomonas paucimobilis TaxID=13689 RepID=UPI00203FDB5C|nr:hypothetical protein [Sphingomonas paucimobilis]MCM3680967.1 hypothetical protein [Sphingomonas paucimobilis]